MAAKTQLFILTLLVCTLLVVGCFPSDTGKKAVTPRVDQIKEAPPEQQKARLLDQLSRKFENPDVHFKLGQLYQAEGRWDKAEYHYDIALSFDPVYWPVQAAKVKVILESGNPDKAQLAAEIFMNQAAASAESSLQLGLAFQAQQLGKYALACYQHALRLEPKSPEIPKQIAYYYLSRDDKVNAEQYFRRSFELNRFQPDVAYELGLIGVKIEIEKKTKENTSKSDKIAEQARKKPKS